jgi:hypothetical protein
VYVQNRSHGVVVVVVVLEVVDDVVELVELLVLEVVDDELLDELLLDVLEVVGGIVLIIHHPSMSCLSSLVPRYWSWLLCLR